jgi:pimeloyl-ACP methyl ester carboxylesterase
MTAPLQAHRDGTTTLHDGRELGWAIFGDPEGDTVFWFHGTPGARAQLPHDAGALAVERGLRIVTVERPGTGDSTPHVYEQIVEFAADLRQVADHLDADEFAVVGLSGGGPYLLAAAHELGDRMRAGVVLGGIGPTRGADSIVSHTLLLVPAAALLERVRRPLARGLHDAIDLVKPYADPAVDIFFRLLPGDRAHMTARPLDRRQFTADLVDANDRSGMGAAINDLILFGRHWGFELRNVKVPIVFYGGSSDIIVPYLHAERQSKRVAGSRLRTYEGRGHFAGYTTPADILDDLRELWPATPVVTAPPPKKAVAKKAAAKKAPAKKTVAQKTARTKAPTKKAATTTAAG